MRPFFSVLVAHLIKHDTVELLFHALKENKTKQINKSLNDMIVRIKRLYRGNHFVMDTVVHDRRFIKSFRSWQLQTKKFAFIQILYIAA